MSGRGESVGRQVVVDQERRSAAGLGDNEKCELRGRTGSLVRQQQRQTL